MATTDRPFPWKCPECSQHEVYSDVIPYTAEIKHDGTLHLVQIDTLTVAKCRKCGHVLLGNQADDQITAGLRKQLRFLTPNQIRDNRRFLDLSQSALAKRIGVAEATISRWETGALIQSRAMDNLLRLFFALPEARAALPGESQDMQLGVKIDHPEHKCSATGEVDFSCFSFALKAYGEDGIRAEVDSVRARRMLIPIY